MALVFALSQPPIIEGLPWQQRREVGLARALEGTYIRLWYLVFVCVEKDQFETEFSFFIFSS